MCGNNHIICYTYLLFFLHFIHSSFHNIMSVLSVITCRSWDEKEWLNNDDSNQMYCYCTCINDFMLFCVKKFFLWNNNDDDDKTLCIVWIYIYWKQKLVKYDSHSSRLSLSGNCLWYSEMWLSAWALSIVDGILWK